jgi:ATP-dependent DNA helicase DinG
MPADPKSTDPTYVLSADGPLAAQVPGFAARAAQQEMACGVAAALAEGATLVCEAGTGTGKTFAYLVPALLSGKRILVSTGTKTLQDQLFERDLPTVQRALAAPVSIALLKGRANYVCLFHLREHVRELERGLFPEQVQLALLRQIAVWSETSLTGEISEFRGVDEYAPIWRKATSTSDNCLGQECPDLATCFLLKARQRAAEADVVVINHHLFFADMALRDQGFGELLPGVDAVVLDEAHQLPEVAAGFFGTRLSSRQLAELCQDTVRAEILEAGDCPALTEQAHVCENAVRALRDTLGADNSRAAWQQLAHDYSFKSALDTLKQEFTLLEEMLTPLAVRGKMLESCAQRCAQFNYYVRAVSETPPTAYVPWYETFGGGYIFHLTPLDISSHFQAFRARFPRAWVLTSATLAVGGDFSHFCRQLGLADARIACWQSPFDFRHSALFYLPESLADPSSPQHTDSAVEAALPVLHCSRGRAFFLFTSHRALRIAAERLRREALPYPLLVQGEAPRSDLLAEFRRLGNAILLGTGSFWEGVDVRGEALSCVIIDKLPFASPGDPVLEARLRYLREQGGNPFMDYQLPQAVITLKQGIGRLIRDVTDRGLLMLCDPRLVSKAYGRVFLDSLPPMPRTRSLAVVRRFF